MSHSTFFHVPRIGCYRCSPLSCRCCSWSTLCVQHVAGVLLSESEMEWTCVPARVLGESWPTKHSKANQAQAAVRSTLRNSRTREDLKQQQAHNGMHQYHHQAFLLLLTLSLKDPLVVTASICRKKNVFSAFFAKEMF